MSTKIKLQIKNRYTGSIIFEYEHASNDYKKTVKEFLKENKDKVIYEADLSNMDLSNMSFDGSRFVGSTFVGSRFDGSRFDGSRFVGSTFVGSTFDGSTFVGSTFDGSTFVGSTFDGSTFVGSTFDNDTVKNIIANNQLQMFDTYKNDLWAVLLKSKEEIPGLKEAITLGKIDGSKYEGSCACLKGTIANIRHCSYKELAGIKANASEPSEQWFMMLKPGMTSETSEVAKLTIAWIEEFEMYLKK